MSAEAAGAFEGFIAPAALANKKQMGAVLDASASVHVSVPSRVTDLVRSIGAKGRAILDRLGLGALAQTIGEAVKGGATWLGQKAAAVGGYLGKLLGFKTMAVYAVTDTPTRAAVISGASFAVRVVKAPFRWLGKLVSWVPFVGKPIVRTWNTGYDFVADWVGFGVTTAHEWLAVRQDRWYVAIPRGFAMTAMVARVIARFVPGPIKPFAWAAYLALTIGPPLLAAMREFAADPDVQKFREEVLAPAAAKTQDLVHDRVAEGPIVTQPHVENVEMVDVKTGKRTALLLETDVRGQRWVTIDGVKYDFDSMGQGANDPFRPVNAKDDRPKVMEQVSKILVDADEAEARLLAARPKDGAEQAAASTGAAPQPPRPTRAVRRAAAAAAKKAASADGAQAQSA